MITVTAAIIEKNGLFLAARRRLGSHLAGFWEFPGGKLEKGETEAECLARELAEEFGVRCRVGDCLTEVHHDYGDKIVRLRGFFVQHLDGVFQLHDHDALLWLPVGELGTLQWAPADVPLVKALQRKLLEEKISQFYRENADKYIEETKGLDMTETLHRFLGYLPLEGHILDLGCGSGRDTIFFQQHGYRVTAMDASPEIATICSLNIGQKVLVAPAQSLDVRECYDGIWACASLLHIPTIELDDTLRRIYVALKPGGVCYMSFKKGHGERWDERGRFFLDTTSDVIRQYLCHIDEIDIIDIEEQIRPLRGKQQAWVNVFFRKG